MLLTLARVPASSADELYDAIAAIPWEDHVRPDGTIAVDATGVNSALRNTQFTAVRVKDAIADRFVMKTGRRPSVDTARPDLRINVVVRAERATVSIDLAGEPLHRRGYRQPGVQVAAPMKETLAAAMLQIAGWPKIAAEGGAFIDPMCGSGTLPIEAALMAADIAPGLLRSPEAWGFGRWLGHDAARWARLEAEARRRRDAGMAALPPIEGFDVDPRAVEVALACVRRAGLEGAVRIAVRGVDKLAAPAPDAALTRASAAVGGGLASRIGSDDRGIGRAAGLVALNPPYGERIGDRAGLPALYAQLASGVRAEGFQGWKLAVITADPDLARGLRMTPQRTVGLYNGRIPTTVSVFALASPSEARETSGGPTPSREARPLQAAAEAGVRATSLAPLTEGAAAFENRLVKMARHLGKWARKAGVTCYRVYDADLPDYAVAIDVYEGAAADKEKRWVHISEYAPPAAVDPERSMRRLDDVLAIVPDVLGVEAEDVFLKVRQRQRGSAQYERISRKGVVGTVSEGGLLFEVNMSDYLDTGLFLDHRLTRAWLRELAPGKRFLNLFAYTGSATVYAADGGATSTLTVDMSSTYLDWAARNMSLNGFKGAEHARVRADVLEWVSAARLGKQRFDLIFCDPPTFSNSKRMEGTWDVQRDHGPFLVEVAELLADGGVLVFSCNRRKFEFDAESLSAAGLDAEEVTARTISRDFERRPDMHRCWTIHRR